MSTLLLLDYHHDISALQPGVTSFNWVGALLNEGLLSRVIWVSGRTLLLPNRNSRMKWLRRSMEGFAPSDAERIQSRVTLMDWSELRTLQIRGPYVVSLDLDILAHDPGDSPERFLDELSGWIAARRPPLLTVAFSAAYQRDASTSWKWIERFVRCFAESGASWYLEGGTESSRPESLEENGSWGLWETLPDSFARYGQGFWPGLGIWVEAPMSFRDALEERAVRPGDKSASEVLSGWIDADRLTLEHRFPPKALDRLATSAAISLESGWKGRRAPEPPAGLSATGVAVRLLDHGLDRGCLSLYEGVSDIEEAVQYCVQAAAKDPRYPPVFAKERPELEVELSIFGPWHVMKDPMDFRPGLDSLLLEEGGRTTLLQSSLAVERRYDRSAFLTVLARKAGLNGWNAPGIIFKRAATIWSLRTLPSIEEEDSSKTDPKRR